MWGSQDLRRPREPSRRATDVDPRPRTLDRDFPRGPCSPACSRIGALQVLHLREYVAEMLTVLAALAMPGMRSIFGTLKSRLGQYLVDTRRPGRLNVGQS